MRLGPSARIGDLIDKLESVDSTVESREGILAQFHSAKQQSDENVIKWGCRLEDILAKSIDKGFADQSKKMRC